MVTQSQALSMMICVAKTLFLLLLLCPRRLLVDGTALGTAQQCTSRKNGYRHKSVLHMLCVLWFILSMVYLRPPSVPFTPPHDFVFGVSALALATMGMRFAKKGGSLLVFLILV